jgi:glycosyltransferase involved in cell wall biosynthesis
MLSILIPAYNCEDVIDEAVESALSEAGRLQAEVVIVDDGSHDSTLERARAWQSRSPERIRVGSHERNRGGGAARNTAAELATGDELYILDADNVLPASCVSSQLELMRSSGLHAVSVGQLHHFERSTTEVIGGWVMRHSGGRSTVRHLFETDRVAPAHGNYLYTRHLFEATGGYAQDAGAMDTWTFGLKHLARGFEIGIDARSHYLHRLNRPDRESYWMREEHAGTNDVNAIRALRQEIEKLPAELSELVLTLRLDDPFFELVRLGAFRSGPSRLRDVKRFARVRHRARRGAYRALAAGARARRTLAAQSSRGATNR